MMDEDDSPPQIGRERAMTTTQVPVSIPQDVVDFIAGLGIRDVFDEIVAKTSEMFPDARQIECEIDPGIEDESDAGVVIGVALPESGPTYPTPHMRWADWAVHRFPGRVLYYITMIHWYEPGTNAGT
jgi:hypothetical protein